MVIFLFILPPPYRRHILTSPKSRLDLRPQSRPISPLSHDDNWTDPESNNRQQQQDQQQQEQQQQQQRSRRSSRFLDLHRLRHASIEERIEILRRHRSQQQQQQQRRAPSRSSGGTDGTDGTNTTAATGGGADGEAEGRRRLADRLRERFHIRTRAVSPVRDEGI